MMIYEFLLLLVLATAFSVTGFSLLRSRSFAKFTKCQMSMGWNWGGGSKGTNTVNIEKNLINLIRSEELSGRGAKASTETLEQINKLVEELETSSNRIKNPTQSPLLDGCWRLLYTSSPGTNSPIQRTFTALDSVSIYQVVNVVDTSRSLLPGKKPDVSNTVCFGDQVRLRVTALGSTVQKPMIEPRKGDGKIFGFNIFGISSSAPPRDAEERIDFAFQDAAFEFKSLPLPSIPYPVPFKLLGDEAKGWIDVTYLSETLRIARGNKGTLFLLERADPSTDSVAAFAVENLADKGEKSIKSTIPEQISESSGRAAIMTAMPSLSSLFTSDIFNDGTFSKVRKAAPALQGSKDVAIIFPAQLGTKEDYDELVSALVQATNGRLQSYVAPLGRLDWPIGLLPSFFSIDYARGTLQPSKTLQFYYDKVNLAVEKALTENKDAELVLIAHSIGGWIARAWLGECASAEVKSRVKKLITLGSPHNPPPADSFISSFDQTRGLLTYINEQFPGAYEKDVQYVSVIGTEIEGALSTNIDSLLAYGSYLFLAGKGNTIGDGIIPVETSALSGAEKVEIAGVKHTNYVPTLGTSVKLPWRWYGSDDAVEEWIEFLT